jgi:2-methylaconitate cis-trans-isomerase PrpF
VALIEDNDTLTSLSGLEGLSSLGSNLDIINNDSLCEEEVDELAAQLNTRASSVNNQGNTGTCPS